jgi:hypothetical protein
LAPSGSQAACSGRCMPARSAPSPSTAAGKVHILCQVGLIQWRIEMLCHIVSGNSRLPTADSAIWVINRSHSEERPSHTFGGGASAPLLHVCLPFSAAGVARSRAATPPQPASTARRRPALVALLHGFAWLRVYGPRSLRHVHVWVRAAAGRAVKDFHRKLEVFDGTLGRCTAARP